MEMMILCSVVEMCVIHELFAVKVQNYGSKRVKQSCHSGDIKFLVKLYKTGVASRLTCGSTLSYFLCDRLLIDSFHIFKCRTHSWNAS